MRERRGTPATDTPTQSETETEPMNEQAKGPGDDSTVRFFRVGREAPPFIQTHVVGRGSEAKHWERKSKR